MIFGTLMAHSVFNLRDLELTNVLFPFDCIIRTNFREYAQSEVYEWESMKFARAIKPVN